MSSTIHAVLFDLSGVLYEGGRLIEGAPGAVADARGRGLEVRFVTNTATKTRGAILEKLGGFGIEVGAFIHGLAWAAEIEPVVMGKPSAAFFEQVVATTGCEPAECLMIGDDAESDVAAACEAGLRGALVKTGKYQEGHESRLPGEAEVIGPVRDLGALLDRAG